MKLQPLIQKEVGQGTIRALMRQVNRGRLVSVEGASGFRREVTSAGTRLRARRRRRGAGGSSSVDTSSPWYPTVMGASVTIATGAVLVLGKVYQLLGGTLVVTGGTYANPHYVIVRVNRATGSASLDVQASAPNPQNASSVEWPLHQVYMSGGTVVILRTLEKGVVFVGNLT